MYGGKVPIAILVANVHTAECVSCWELNAYQVGDWILSEAWWRQNIYVHICSEGRMLDGTGEVAVECLLDLNCIQLRTMGVRMRICRFIVSVNLDRFLYVSTYRCTRCCKADMVAISQFSSIQRIQSIAKLEDICAGVTKRWDIEASHSQSPF